MIEFKQGRTFEIEDYAPFIGRLGNEKLEPLPNAEEVPANMFLQNIASGGHGMQPVWGYARLPDSDRNQWTQFFLTTYMMSGLDGCGYAVTYGSGQAILRYFRICKHSKLDSPDARPMRGWHPGICTKCGFNMTYDSGD